MHIKVEIRGYYPEKEMVYEAMKKLQWFIKEDLTGYFWNKIGEENLEEDEEIIEFGSDIHLYPQEDEERYYVG
jgi:hypothetical protein